MRSSRLSLHMASLAVAMGAVHPTSLVWPAALDKLAEAQAKGGKVGTAYSDVVTAVNNARRWKLACQMFAEMQEAKAELTDEGFTAALDALEMGQLASKRNRPEDVCEFWRQSLALLDEMADRKIPVDSRSYTHAVEAMIQAGLTQKGKWEKALDMIDEGRKGKKPILTAEHAELLSMAALAKGKEWEKAQGMLRKVPKKASEEHRALAFSRAVAAASISDQWEHALSLLEEMEDQDLKLDYWGYDEARMAFGRQLIGGETVDLLKRRFQWSDEDPMELLTELKPTPFPRPIRPPPRPLGPDLANVEIPPGSQYSKELRLLQYVFKNAKRGQPKTVCDAIEGFGQGVLGGRGQWLKVAGAGKSDVLTATLRAAPPGGQILEIGAYCGFSSSRMTLAVPNVHINTLEVDPVHVIVARNVIEFGGLTEHIDVWTGHSKDLIPRLAGRFGGADDLFFSAAFFDQKGTRYDEDLTALERTGLLYPGAVLVADNVLKPGAPLFLWHIVTNGDYESQIVSMQEFAMPSEDWMSVSVRRLSAEKHHAGQPPLPPDPVQEKRARARKWQLVPTYLSPEGTPDLHLLAKETDKVRDRAVGPRSVSFDEWAEFAKEVKDRLGKSGVLTTARPE